MRTRVMAMGMLALALASGTPANAQLARTNALWARTAPGGSITLDGLLNEAVWSQAESWKVRYRVDLNNPQDRTMGIPGSGWKDEGGINPPNDPTNDSTNATLRFLVIGNKLYMGATVPDRSIGGGGGFNYFDGFLMGLKDHGSTGTPKPISEYLYSWWYPREAGIPAHQCVAAGDTVGRPPLFKGRWAPDPVCDGLGNVIPRTPEQIAAWDARTAVNGVPCNPNCGTATNNDVHGIDTGYTIEMVFDLGVMGYDVTQPIGDIVEWNISIYDTDNYWKTLGPDLSRNRTWWAAPWGNVAEQDEVRIYARPNVTTVSGPVPAIDPDFRIPITGSPAPTINGALTEAVWAAAPNLNIKYNDATLRNSYAGVGKHRSGEYQPRLTINDPEPAPLPFVVDGGDATVKYFFKGDFLYLGFDVRDTRVQSNAFEDFWDGFTVGIAHRGILDPVDHNLHGMGLSFRVSATGTAATADTLFQLVNAGLAQVALQLKAGSTVDSTGNSTDDTGYTAELRVDMKALGYPPGLGDHTMFMGICLHDHDRYSNPESESYSTRTWWYRERKEACCPAWTLLDGTFVIGSTTDVGDGVASSGFQALGNTPNPFGLTTTLEFALGRESDVELSVFDVNGRLVTQRALGRMMAGKQQALVQLPAGKSGVYLYRVRAKEPGTGALMATINGKMMHLR